MLPKWSSFYALIYLFVCFNVVAAGRLGPYPRQETSPSTTEATKTTQDGDRETTTTSPDNSETHSSSSAKPTSVEVTTSVTSTPAATAIPSALNGNNPSNDSFSEQPAVIEGELPLQPRLTPGWGVSGAIMLITGIVYALVGIKNTRLHTFFSSAYLASLSITVLIVYVMNLPVSDAVQGAYVVGAICAGLIVGGAATIFKELTEGLGCLLGGFCFSMWLLTLHEGGLLPSTAGKAIFIAAFTVAGFAFYFSHYTRPYAMIGLMSFSGATITVLGIDCFSRAGLKEFWAYIWNLNDDLFPLETTTYPLTKGIKVEVAIIIVLTVLGLISQFKLWRVIQDHRARRLAAEAEFQRMRDEEEANVGRRVEEDNKRERRQWETAYGDLSTPPSPTVSRDSGVGEIENEKKGQVSRTTVQPVSSSETENENAIEMADLPSENNTSSEAEKQLDEGLVIAGHDEDNRVTVRVSRDYHNNDESMPLPEPDEKAWMAGVESESQPVSPTSRNSRRISKLAGPEIIPLPFKVPEPQEEEEIDDGDRSSFATFADEDDRSITLSKRASRASLSHRLSVGSGNLLRSLSQRSKRSEASKRQTGEFELPQHSPGWGGSKEGLVSKDQKPPRDTGSIAATVDGMSDSSEKDTILAKAEEPTRTGEIKAELADRQSKGESTPDNQLVAQPKPNDSGAHFEVRPYSVVETVATDILNPSLLGEPPEDGSKTRSGANAAGKVDGVDETNKLANVAESKTPSDTSKVAKSASPSAVSSASLTKEHLPSSLSRVALSYRTNEWAKHLTLAETPEPDTLYLNEYPEAEEEVPAPVNVDELQQTAEGGIPPAPIVRSPSSVSNVGSNAQLNRSSSGLTVTDGSNVIKATQLNVHTGQNLRMKGRRQSGDIIIQPILEENGEEHLSIKAGAIQEERDGSVLKSGPPSPLELEPQITSRLSVPGVVSYSSPQTLIGKRDMFLRSKSQSTLLLSQAIPETTQYSFNPTSQMEQPYNSLAPSPFVGQDADDLPLSKRKELIRQSSLLPAKSAAVIPRPNSTMRMAYTPGLGQGPSSPVAAESAQFDSHQPQRHSTAPSQAHREALLASFRQSVAVDLRAGTPISPAANNSGEAPMIRSSSATLLGPIGLRNGSNDVQQTIDQQRSVLLSQREQEAQRKEQERREKERNERAFEEMMRRGDLMDAHREAMRKMQRSIKDQ
ncbi:uncharacterized protein F4812DRAFT_58213 [Daldinia caldariorum]|uniref:uncharacterized protein n=1 Tax=Daldinia caldariorum TaxID=326644 RepID=UPI002007B173|nr:uncharacterized protein F4812DRAFT_58213 [Daldinia caldariorum]KAI1467297.1 hypothetical protein F4812DRAFT_58213 [Daldinia caldariorum]